MNKVIDRIGILGIVPVLVVDSPKDILSIGQALLRGGISCAEITFRTSAAEEAIRILARNNPQMLVGAGTVLSVKQAEEAVGAGARFIVSPGFDPKVVDWCLERNIAVVPGVATPTEILMGLDRGINILKFFPAGVLGGTKALKAIGAAFRTVKFIPTGGVNADNLAEYLSLPMVHACGGSWITPRTLVDSGQFDQISVLAREAWDTVSQVRGEMRKDNE
ncbi:MAG: bifunctional 4-hydroxy-2-oxoglutarate aldolase/2-dehydro-3-deoxy-phosphogluconate aldolase [Anaerolineales bacterium]|nr:bifunctional 4-hydroxy-2-oxoglutarate aldolase/2-dehydro-3-deoxy-phosphogluconate aldolase [Anaerolineales bacterium]